MVSGCGGDSSTKPNPDTAREPDRTPTVPPTVPTVTPAQALERFNEAKTAAGDMGRKLNNMSTQALIDEARTKVNAAWEARMQLSETDRTALTTLRTNFRQAEEGRARHLYGKISAAITNINDYDPTTITAARTALTDAEDAYRKAGLTGAFANLRSRIGTKETQAGEKMGEAMYAALEGPKDDGSQNALDNISGAHEDDRFDNTDADGVLDFVIGPADGGGSITGDADSSPAAASIDSVRFRVDLGTDAGMLGDWKGTDLEMDVMKDPKGKDKVRVYTDKGEPTTPLAATWFANSENRGTAGAGSHTDGERKLSLQGDDLDNVHVASPRFPTAGKKRFKLTDAESGSNQIQLRGTLAGAPGHYVCMLNDDQDNCGIAKGPKGWKLESDWEFIYDEGARMSLPDANYLYFGWWVRENANGMPTIASVFYASEGPTDYADEVPLKKEMSGTATYVGKAAGLYGIKDPLNKKSSGGHFTADAKFTASFDEDANAEIIVDGFIMGTIDNFRLNGGSENPGWSVALGKRRNTTTSGTTDYTAPTSYTTWSIKGVEAAAAAHWVAKYYDDKREDELDIPNSVMGTFYAEIGRSHRMVGAFGAKIPAQKPAQE